jgi:hypothetical protein
MTLFLSAHSGWKKLLSFFGTNPKNQTILANLLIVFIQQKRTRMVSVDLPRLPDIISHGVLTTIGFGKSYFAKQIGVEFC